MSKTENKYKQGCIFKEKVDCCTFRVEDCNVNECDFYPLDATIKSISDKAKEEIKVVKDIEKQLIQLRKSGNKKSDEYKELKRLQGDKAKGVYYMSKALGWLKRTGKGR